MMDEDQYQDIRVNGKTVSYGRRECESRYKAIKPFLERYKDRESFTILDFGANYGYFSWRIKEDFPNAKITMVDSRPLLKLLYQINNTEGMTLLSEDMDINRIKEYGTDNHFDLIVLMSIIHHFQNPEEVIDVFMTMTETVLCEINYPDQPCFTGLQERVHNHLFKMNPIQINSWIDHDRPVYYVNKNEGGITGRVKSGSGQAQLNIPNINQFEWFGIKMFPGTLNIDLTKGIKFNETIKMGAYTLAPMYINGFPVFAIKDYNLTPPDTFLEIISPINLRKKFNLKNEDEVFISFEKRNVKEI